MWGGHSRPLLSVHKTEHHCKRPSSEIGSRNGAEPVVPNCHPRICADVMPNQSSDRAMEYRREIDGLRAIAVLSVILFHAGFQTFGGGFVGVDVFFVISGYLITTIILSELDQGKFSITKFYERRARRILPALFAVMTVCLPFAWLSLMPEDLQDFSRSLVAVSLFVSNVLFWKNGDYFADVAEFIPLLHTWSLAVEEQYYVLFPICLRLTWGLGKRRILGLLVVTFFASLGTAQWASVAKPMAAFFLLPTRGWELLVGAFVAFYLLAQRNNFQSRVASEIGGFLGLGLIIYAVFFFGAQMPFPSLYTLVPTVGAALIIVFSTERTFVAKLLSNKLLVGVGLVSYSAYLWHQPLFAFARHMSQLELESKPLFLILTIVTLVIAYLTWKYIEMPFRVKSSFSQNHLLVLVIMLSALFIIVGLCGNIYYSSKIPSIDYRWGQYVRQHQCLLQDPTVSKHDPDCITSRKSVLLWGDSHAASLLPGLFKLSEKHSFGVSQLTQTGCAPLTDIKILIDRKNCNLINEKILHQISVENFGVIILHAAWIHPDYPMTYEDFELKSEAMIHRIKTTAPESKIIIISNVPRWHISAVRADSRAHSIRRSAYESVRYSIATTLPEIDRILSRVASRNGVTFISPVEHLCLPSATDANHRPCVIAVNSLSSHLAYVDWGHLSRTGSEYLAELIEYELRPAIGGGQGSRQSASTSMKK